MAAEVTETVELITVPAKSESAQRPVSPTFRRLQSEEPSAKKPKQPSYKKSISWDSPSKLGRSTSQQRKFFTISQRFVNRTIIKFNSDNQF